MSHWLPGIDIAITLVARSFLEQMAEVGRASGRFDVELHWDALGAAGFDVVNFRLREDRDHQELGFQLISEAPDLRRVKVELRAFRWTPDRPTTAVYENAARSVVAPILMAYNRAHSTRYRLRIEKASKSFKPSARTVALLDRFAVLANTASLHPRDWERFYQLVRESRQEIPEPHLRAMLARYGFSPQTAERLADLHVHLWAFKRFR
ncbi:MAG: hypothetical protein GC203_14025 [Phenylobacterium sp.]|uniref:hypothetical protein n=1 Tax=Phenylobacterium sp. TaxID=1871053 RepID=UPI0025E89DB7|nr:hypothetical protein [Phenylobacterium sp.]MBI1198974.1 hypothetical protein [Phenylobacterium sp.]